MDAHTAALATAGVIGSLVAIAHGVLTQRLMGRPVLATTAMRPRMRRLAALLLQFSTYNWFLSGLALLAAALWLGREARVAVGLLAGSSYVVGALGNLWASRGRHPGWALYALAVALIGYGLSG